MLWRCLIWQYGRDDNREGLYIYRIDYTDVSEIEWLEKWSNVIDWKKIRKIDIFLKGNHKNEFSRTINGIKLDMFWRIEILRETTEAAFF